MKRNLSAFLAPFLNSKPMRAWIMILGFTMIYFVVAKYNDQNYWEAFTQIITDSQFLSIFVFPFFLFFLISNTHQVDSNLSFLVRFSSKKDYVKQTLKQQLISVSSLYFILLIFLVIFLNFLVSVDLSSYQLETIKINNLLFFIVQVIKLYIFLLFFTIYNFVLLHWLDEKIIVGLNFLFCGFLFLESYIMVTPQSLFEFPIFIGHYLTSSMSYARFQDFLMACGFQFLLLSFGLLILFVLWKGKNYELYRSK